MRVQWVSLCNIFLLLLAILSTHRVISIQSPLTENETKDIANLAARILNIAVSENSYYNNEKRNAGTVDSLYNLPRLLDVGRRRRR